MIGNPIGYPIGGVISNGVTVIFGTLSATEADDTVSSSATLTISAAASVTEAADTSSATGAVSLSAVASISEAPDTLTATAALEIAGQESGQEAPDTVAATGALAIGGTLSATEQDDTLSGTIGYSPLHGVLDVTEDDDTLFADSTIRLPNNGGFAPERKPGHKKRSRKEADRLLEQALAKAFDPKRSSIIDRAPWLAEPVPEVVLLEQPEFNPRLAALQGEAQRIEAQLAQIQFNRAQEEADIELLLMAL